MNKMIIVPKFIIYMMRKTFKVHDQVEVIHASVTQKVMSKMQHFRLVTCDIWFGLCSVVQLLMKMLHLAQHFVSDGGLFHLNF